MSASSRIRIKMCGMTRAEDVAYAIQLGVDAVGIIFYPKSARNVSIPEASALLQDLPPFMDAVAVLVNPEQDFVRSILETLPISVLQFHGEESPDFCAQFNAPFIKTVHPKTTAEIEHAAYHYHAAHALLLDSASDTAKGGTGVVFDWDIIPESLPRPFILAGGLNATNVADARRVCAPYAVDVCSGVECAPGVKDHAKMHQFVTAVWGIT